MKIVNQILRLILLIITMSIVLFMFLGDITKNSMAVTIFSIALGIYAFIICVVGNRITKAKIWAWVYVLILLGLVLSFMLLAAQKEDTDTHSNWVYYIVYAVFACGEADAVLAASVFHFGTFSIREVKEYMASQGIAVRLDF